MEYVLLKVSKFEADAITNSMAPVWQSSNVFLNR